MPNGCRRGRRQQHRIVAIALPYVGVTVTLLAYRVDGSLRHAVDVQRFTQPAYQPCGGVDDLARPTGFERRLGELVNLQTMTDAWVIVGLFAALAAVLWIGTPK
jgi:hypothetical protein